jgi:hypothetical protein
MPKDKEYRNGVGNSAIPSRKHGVQALKLVSFSGTKIQHPGYLIRF